MTGEDTGLQHWELGVIGRYSLNEVPEHPPALRELVLQRLHVLRRWDR